MPPVANLSRRAFVAGAVRGLAVVAAGALPELLRIPGLHQRALAQDALLTLESFEAVAAMVWPGNDPHSLAQGHSAPGPGAVAAGAAAHTIDFLNNFIPAPDDAAENRYSAPLAELAAVQMNDAALAVNPLALGGAFVAPFARLSYTEKQDAWRSLEDQAVDTGLGALYTLIPTIVAQLAFSERGLLDERRQALAARPVGWEHTNFAPGRLRPVDGWDDHLGYYRNRQEAES